MHRQQVVRPMGNKHCRHSFVGTMSWKYFLLKLWIIGRCAECQILWYSLECMVELEWCAWSFLCRVLTEKSLFLVRAQVRVGRELWRVIWIMDMAWAMISG